LYTLPNPPNAEQVLAVEAAGGKEQILVREPVRPELHLPVLPDLGVPEPPPHQQSDTGGHREREDRSGHRNDDVTRL
jgi:hypothetical protein